jgi:deoxyribonuclease-4
MLIGAHVSSAGGLTRALQRGEERGCRAIQIFNQSPRMWKPTVYREADVEAFVGSKAESTVEAVLIHAVYLLNCASEDAEVRKKSLNSLTHSLLIGARIGARGVVLHSGSAKAGDVPAAIARAGETIAEALAESEHCPLHLENTAGAGGTLGRSIDELEALLAAAGGDPRLGVCLDSCHLFASGYDIRTPAGMAALVAQLSAKLGLERVGSLHLNDSQTPLGSHRDRHADIGEGELGEQGCEAFLSASALQELPCVLETNGPDGKGATAAEVKLAVDLRERGLRRARRSGSRRRKAVSSPPRRL